MPTLPFPRAALPALALAAAVLARATDKIDLTRTTPVPEGTPIPAQDFFRPPLIREAQLNPSGTRLAALMTGGEDNYSLVIRDLAAKTTETLAGIGDKDLGSIRWLNDQRLLFSLSTLKLYNLGLFAVEAGDIKNSYPLLQYAGAMVVGVPLGHPEHPVAWLSYDAIEVRAEAGPVVVNTDLKFGTYANLSSSTANAADRAAIRESNDRHILSNLPRLPTKSGEFVAGYLADREGNLAYAFKSAGGRTTVHFLDAGAWQPSPLNLDDYDIIAAGNAPGELIALGPAEEGRTRPLVVVTARDGAVTRLLLQDKAYDFAGRLYRHPVTREVIGAQYERAGPQSTWFTDDYRDLQKLLDAFFPGMVVRLVGSDRDQNRFLVATYSDRQPVAYHLVDLKTRAVSPVGSTAPWLDPKRLRPTAIIKFKTRDGHALDAYVTMPEGATKENPPPLVVLPHGGPWARDDWGYDPEAQFLASRGYAVLKPNYRGSIGYAWMFPSEDEWDFRKMHEDVTDATLTLVRSGLIDRRRIAIMGGSFGGYLAVSGVANEPDLYRCAVTLAGVFDWAEMIQDRKFYQFDSPAYARMVRKLGDPKKAKEKFDLISPLRIIDHVKVPVFVAHGREDAVVSIDQSKMLVAELEKHHVPHEVLFVSGERHGMAHLDNRVELYTRIEQFLAKNLRDAR